ncbi:MAG: Brp/Blh family beta-carotene 15,15'-dioxygenase [Flavobacteriaceae bacterium]
MPKYFTFSHIITLISTLLAILTSQFNQNLISSIGILTVGIIHGANDLKIISKKTGIIGRVYTFKMFGLYLGVVGLGIGTFYYIPGLALLAFVLVSCYHFGEQHWQSTALDLKSTPLYYFSYGALIFLLLFSFHYEETAEIIYAISGVSIPFAFFWISLVGVSLLVLIQLFLGVKEKHTLIREWSLLMLLSFLFSQANLLFGFGLYFVLWHSIPSLKSQIRYLYKRTDLNGYRSFFRSGMLYWILALLSLGTAFKYWDVTNEQYLPLFFSFLAAITFPHAVVMSFLFQSKSKE